MDVGRGHDKGLDLSRRARYGEGKAGGALEGGGVLEKLAPEIAMPRKKASSKWAGTASCFDDADEGSELYTGCYVHDRRDGSYQKSLS